MMNYLPVWEKLSLKIDNFCNDWCMVTDEETKLPASVSANDYYLELEMRLSYVRTAMYRETRKKI